MPKQIELEHARQLPAVLKLEGCLVNPATGAQEECHMDFIRDSGGAQDRQLAELARLYGCPPGSLLCVPKDSDQLPELYEPGEFHGPGFMLHVTTADVLEADGEAEADTEAAVLRVDPFTVVGWDTLRQVALSEHESAVVAAAWVEEINALLNRVGSELENDPDADVPAGLVAQFLCCRIADRVEVAELPAGLDYDMVTRYCAASELRRRIALVSGEDPENPAERLEEILGPELAGQMRVDTGSRFRSVIVGLAAGDSRAAEFSRRNDALVRRLFASLTRTPVEEISCGFAPRDAHEEISNRLDDAAVDGDGAGRGDLGRSGWMPQVAAETRNILEDVFGRSYQPQVDLWEIGGNDIILVRDFASAYVYSWPSADRNVVFAPEGEVAIPMIDPSECPTPEGLAELQQELGRRVSAQQLVLGLHAEVGEEAMHVAEEPDAAVPADDAPEM